MDVKLLVTVSKWDVCLWVAAAMPSNGEHHAFVFETHFTTGWHPMSEYDNKATEVWIQSCLPPRFLANQGCPAIQ